MTTANKIVGKILGKGNTLKTLRQRFDIGDTVWYRGRKAVVADHTLGTYALWDKSGKKELIIEGKEDIWVPEITLALRND